MSTGEMVINLNGNEYIGVRKTNTKTDRYRAQITNELRSYHQSENVTICTVHECYGGKQ